MKKNLWIPSACVSLLASTTVWACPFCHTATGVAIHAGIFDGPFLATALATAAPFPVLLGVVAAFHFGWHPAAWMRNRARHDRPCNPTAHNVPGNTDDR